MVEFEKENNSSNNEQIVEAHNSLLRAIDEQVVRDDMLFDRYSYFVCAINIIFFFILGFYRTHSFLESIFVGISLGYSLSFLIMFIAYDINKNKSIKQIKQNNDSILDVDTVIENLSNQLCNIQNYKEFINDIDSHIVKLKEHGNLSLDSISKLQSLKKEFIILVDKENKKDIFHKFIDISNYLKELNKEAEILEFSPLVNKVDYTQHLKGYL